VYCVVYPAVGEAVLMRRRTLTPTSQTSFYLEGHGGSSTRRAMSRACRYGVGNNLLTQVVLTFAEQPTRGEALAQASLLMRRLRRNVFGGSFPYLLCPEGGTRHRVHVHAMTPVVKPGIIIEDWSHGLAHVSVVPDRPALRAAARYVVKEFSSSPRGQRRYRAARGFAPEAVRFVADDEPQAWREINQVMGGPPTRVDVGHIIRAEWE
jgi:hypothetical protein